MWRAFCGIESTCADLVLLESRSSLLGVLDRGRHRQPTAVAVSLRARSCPLCVSIVGDLVHHEEWAGWHPRHPQHWAVNGGGGQVDGRQSVGVGQPVRDTGCIDARGSLEISRRSGLVSNRSMVWSAAPDHRLGVSGWHSVTARLRFLQSTASALCVEMRGCLC